MREHFGGCDEVSRSEVLGEFAEHRVVVRLRIALKSPRQGKAAPAAGKRAQRFDERQRSQQRPYPATTSVRHTQHLHVKRSASGGTGRARVSPKLRKEPSAVAKAAAVLFVAGNVVAVVALALPEVVLALEAAPEAGALGADVVAPVAEVGVEAAEVVGGLSRAAEFGFKPYAQLRGALQGTGLQAHHLIEQRFADLLGQKAREMLEQVVSAARQIYASYPEILTALGL